MSARKRGRRGPPGEAPDDETSIAELERLVQEGAPEAAGQLAHLAETMRSAVPGRDDALLDSLVAHPDVLAALAQAAIEGNGPQDVGRWATLVLGRDRSSIVALALLSVAQELQGQLKEALETCDRLVAAAPEDGRSYLRRAGVLLSVAGRGGADEDIESMYRRAVEDLDRSEALAGPNVDVILRRAEVQASLDHREEAMADFTRAIELDPDSAEAYNARGVFHEAGEEYEQALADYEQVVRLAAENPVGYRNRGDARAALGRHEEAIDDYTRSVELEPSYVPAFLGRGRAREAVGTLELALQDYEAAIALEPENVLARGLHGTASIALGDRLAGTGDTEAANRAYATAVADLDEVLRLSPSAVQGFVRRGQARAALGQYEEAVADYARAIELDPDSAEAYNARGILHEIRAEYEEALADYEQVIRLAPESPVGYRNRGDVHAALGRHEEAIADYTKAVELEPSYVPAFVARGQAREALGSLELALEDYEAAIGLDPENVPARGLHGIASIALGDRLAGTGDTEAANRAYATAVADLDEVLRLSPLNPEGHLEHGVALARMGDSDRALADFTKAIELAPDSAADGYNQRGLLHEIREENEQALADYEQVVRLAPESPVGYRNRGDALAALGRHEEAIADYTKAVELDPSYAAAFVARGQAREAAGTLELALQDYDAAIALEPKRAELYLDRAECLRAMADYERAIWDYGRALELDPGDLASLAGRALANLGVGEAALQRGAANKMREAYENAVADCETGLSFDPNNPYLHRYRAAALVELDAFDEAAEALGSAIKAATDLDPVLTEELEAERADASRRWGELCKQPERVEEALKAFRRILKDSRDPGTAVWVFEASGLALSFLGRHRQAVQAYSKSIERGGEVAGVHLSRAKSHYRLGELELAVEGFNRAIELAAGDPGPTRTAHVGLGLVHSRGGKSQEAAEQFAAALDSTLTGAAFLQRATAFEELGEQDHAREDRFRALELEPTSADGHNDLAWAYLTEPITSRPEASGFRLDLVNEALVHAILAVQLEGTGQHLANALDTLGWAYYRLGRFPEAEAQLKQAVSLTPRPVDIRLHLEQAQVAQASASPVASRA